MSTTQQTLFSVPSISCNGCARAIQSTLSKISGVTDTTVDVPTKLVTVTHQSEIERADLVAALYAADFPATLVSASDKN